MKYGITQWAFANGIGAIRLAAAAGYDGIQVETGMASNGYYLRQKTMQKLYLEETKRNDLEIISVVDNDIMHVGCMGDKTCSEYRQSILAIDMTIETAVGLGCNRIMIPMFHKSQIFPDLPESMERAVEVFQYACKHAGEEGILVQAETSLSAADQHQLFKMINMPNLVSFFDSQNLYWHGGLDSVKELPGLLSLNGPEMHFSDGWGFKKPGGNGALLLGEGSGHFEEQIKMICESKWDGWMIVENNYYLPTMYERFDCLTLAKRDLETLKCMVQSHKKTCA